MLVKEVYRLQMMSYLKPAGFTGDFPYLELCSNKFVLSDLSKIDQEIIAVIFVHTIWDQSNN